MKSESWLRLYSSVDIMLSRRGEATLLWTDQSTQIPETTRIGMFKFLDFIVGFHLSAKIQSWSLIVLVRFRLSRAANANKEGLFDIKSILYFLEPIKPWRHHIPRDLFTKLDLDPFSVPPIEASPHPIVALPHPPPVLGIFFLSSSACPHFRERLLAETLTGSTRLDKLRRDFCSTFNPRKRRLVKGFLRLGVTP